MFLKNRKESVNPCVLKMSENLTLTLETPSIPFVTANSPILTISVGVLGSPCKSPVNEALMSYTMTLGHSQSRCYRKSIDPI